LVCGGRSVAEIAQILNVSDKTIRRDQDQIRKRNANKPSADYTIEVFGELLQKAKSAHENMMRLSRSPEARFRKRRRQDSMRGK
jgi:DeoR/GlpR family transcriptional regulator of sugar metabolism